MLPQQRTQQTPSRAENSGLWVSIFFPPSRSLTSFNHVLFMNRFDPFTFSATGVAERSVGGKVSSPPRPTLTQRFSPYSKFASSHCPVASKSIVLTPPSRNVPTLHASSV